MIIKAKITPEQTEKVRSCVDEMMEAGRLNQINPKTKKKYVRADLFAICTTSVLRREKAIELLEITNKELGQGQGVGKPRQAIGGAEQCVCPKCGATKTHERGIPCNKTKCSKCGAMMIGKPEKTSSIKLKAKWTTEFMNNLPDAAFAVILPGGKKDDGGKTVPRGLRKLPHHKGNVKSPIEDTSVDLPHLRAALARVNQPKTELSPSQRSKAKAHLMGHARRLKVGEAAEKEEKSTFLREFTVFAPVTKAWVEKTSQGDQRYMEVTLSGLKEDRDGDRMSENAVDNMIAQIKSGNVPFYLDHGLDEQGNRAYRLKDMCGVWVDARRENELLKAVVKLNNANPDADVVWKYKEAGMPIGFSIGGKVIDKFDEDVE